MPCSSLLKKPFMIWIVGLAPKMKQAIDDLQNSIFDWTSPGLNIIVDRWCYD